eukprot:GHVO01070100.1.p1 GENE.GHVO01070100.1~~GHVO01070100.1.p1  ORF type:complete len:565 (+),score=84.97 GHVO01070100.1:524-2218(+)
MLTSHAAGLGSPTANNRSTTTTTSNASLHSNASVAPDNSAAMVRTRKKRKFFKFFSCLSSKADELPEETIASSSPQPSSTSPVRSGGDANSDSLATVAKPTAPSPVAMVNATEQLESPDSSVKTASLTSTEPCPVTSEPDVRVTDIAVSVNGADEEDEAVEIPPPMDEIQTHQLPSAGSTQDDDEEVIAPVDPFALPAPVETEETDSLTQAPDTSELSEEEATRKKYMHKRRYVIMELIETEKDYVRDLGLCVTGYMELIKQNDIPMPDDMQGKDKIVWGNIHQIYDWHRDTFMGELEKCLAEPEIIGSVFTRYERRFRMYVKYCENKPKSEYLVAEYIEYFEEMRAKLGHRLQIHDLLIKPIQRIMKYQLLLKDILKNTERAGEDTKTLERALEVMIKTPKEANDMMNVSRLQGFQGVLTAQGKLLLQGSLLVLEQRAKVKASDRTNYSERRIFLFEQIIIFSEEIQKKKNNMSNPGYIFKHSIKVNKMSLDEAGDGDPMRFKLIDKTPGSDLRLLCQASSLEERQNWVSHIQNILRMQENFFKALQSPIAYQKELTKELNLF